jgi:rhodanese-related sulfurtransferase
LKTISISELATTNSAELLRVDVRSATEYASGHVPGAVNIPLDEIENRTADLSSDRPIALICQMGQRARMAATLLEPCQLDVLAVEGGTKAWKDAELPIVASLKARWSLERQVRLAAGILVLAGSVLAALVTPYCLILTGFGGAGLTLAGLTDICPMAMLLSRLPWNRASKCSIGMQTSVRTNQT